MSVGSGAEPALNRTETAELLKTWAVEAGFDRAGIASLEPGPGAAAGETFRRWLARGDQAGMQYLERRVEVRMDPASLLPGASSAICVALQYWPLAGEPEPEGDLWPRVARYARGLDYHELMLARLQGLAGRVRAAFPGCTTRPYVDTGPILERDLAARAGLGAIGKNTMLLHPDAGSWFLLGELLLTLDLAPDVPIADLCGSCTRCLEACPTGALREPYRLDSNLCISYWTIEHRGDFPAGAGELLGDWVFGCDICQEACPWNADPVGGDHPELGVPSQRRNLGLLDLASLDRERYTELLRGSPLKRPKLEGLQRNARAVLRNRGGAE